MDNQEVLDNLALAQAQIEWEYSMNISAALDVAMKRCKDWERLKDKIKAYKNFGKVQNIDYCTGYICALSNIEGFIAEMENENADRSD